MLRRLHRREATLPSRGDRPRLRRAAFTMTEVLVVISVIAILITLLFPGVRTALWSSKSQTTRSILAQLAMAIELFRDMRGTYPEGAAACGPRLTEQLGDLLKVRRTCFIDTDANNTLDTVVDAWARPFIYTRYVATSETDAGETNGEGGIQPIHNPSTYDLFSAGAYADTIVGGNDLATFQANALSNDRLKYDHDGEKLTGKGGTPTGQVNRYFGNW